MYDPVIKIPLIVKYPGNEQKGQVHDQLVSNIDVFATITDLADVMIPQYLWKTVHPLEETPERGVIFAEGNRNLYMVRTKQYKLLVCEERPSQFFDLQADPNELQNSKMSSING